MQWRRVRLARKGKSDRAILMRRRRSLRTLLAGWGCASALAFVSCGKSAPPDRTREVEKSAKAPSYATLPPGSSKTVATYRGEGQVQRVDAAQGRVTIRHQEIPGFMGAMTMTFRVKDGKLLDGVRAGDEVQFTLEETPQSVTISSIGKKPAG
jgi:Cu/Ag efflux protein CusF